MFQKTMSYTLYQGTRIGQALKEALEEMEVRKLNTEKMLVIKADKLENKAEKLEIKSDKLEYKAEKLENQAEKLENKAEMLDNMTEKLEKRHKLEKKAEK